jgi:hypothetical protein
MRKKYSVKEQIYRKKMNACQGLIAQLVDAFFKSGRTPVQISARTFVGFVIDL